VGRVATGDRDAFAELYDRYARRVYVVAAHVLGPSRAEDVVQDVFAALWRDARRYDPRRSAFTTWFMAVGRHRVVDELAGKTTLLNTITGVVPPTSGSIELGGRELIGLPPSRIAPRGGARTFQNIRLFRALSVRDNVAVTASVASRHRDAEAPDVDALLARFGLTAAAKRRASTLAYGQQRELELARAKAD
jgi:RNA polymerase sigma factor (sigma-70 family)